MPNLQPIVESEAASMVQDDKDVAAKSAANFTLPADLVSIVSKVEGIKPPPPHLHFCPPGLEYLTHAGQLFIKQKIELFEAVTGYQTNSRYEIKNNLNETLYWAYEDKTCCTRSCVCGFSRQFEIKILDKNQKEVMHLSRPLRCTSCFCPCCLQHLKVDSPKGTTIGFIKQCWNMCRPKYKIQNAEKLTQLRVIGPCCTCRMCGDIEFQITAPDGKSHIGHIIKHWSGMMQEFFTDTESFEITFPNFLDVKIKAALVGLVFLIDFMFFDSTDKKVTTEKMLAVSKEHLPENAEQAPPAK